MSKAIVDAELEVYKPTNSGSTPDSTVPRSDIDRANYSRRIQHSRDRGTIDIDNDGATYTDSITIGDRVTFRAQLEGEGSLSDRWTGLVRDVQFTKHDAIKMDMRLICDDFVFGVFSIRRATEVYDDIQISGTSSSIINDLVTTYAPEIGTTQIDTVSTSTDIELRRQNLIEAFVDIVKREEVILASDGVDFVVKRKSTPNALWTFGANDRVAPWDANHSDSELANDIIIDGGFDTNLDIEQTASDSFQTVTESSRATQVVVVRKSDVASIELDISPTGSGEAVIVRLQKNDGSDSPVQIGSLQSDLARARLESSELIDGFNKFRFQRNDIPDPNPVVIVETDGTTGQDVAFDSGTGDLAHRVFYRFPVVAPATSKSSTDEFRQHDARYRRESISSLEEAKQLAQGLIARKSNPTVGVPFEARSTRAHNLDPLDVIELDEPDVRAEGDFVVHTVTDRYEEERLRTDVTLRDRETI